MTRNKKKPKFDYLGYALRAQEWLRLTEDDLVHDRKEYERAVADALKHVRPKKVVYKALGIEPD